MRNEYTKTVHFISEDGEKVQAEVANVPSPENNPEHTEIPEDNTMGTNM